MRGVECSRSPTTKHEIIRGAVAEYCRFCFIIPRYLVDPAEDEVTVNGQNRRRVVPVTKDTPSAKERTYKIVAPIKGTARANRIKQLIERDGPFCFYCEHPLDPDEPDDFWAPTLDHLLPRSLGGNNSIGNLVLACGDCNLRKGDHVVELAATVRRLRRELAAAKEREAVQDGFIDHMKWELFDAGIGEMPGKVSVEKNSRKKVFKRPMPGLRDDALMLELGQRACANLRAENYANNGSKTASIVRRGRLLARREAVLCQSPS